MPGKRHRHPLADRIDVASCKFRAYRHVFPIRQNVNRDEIDGIIDLAVLQPEFPDVGIGDGNADLRLDAADIGREVGGRHLAAQQDLVADHQRRDHVGKLPGEVHRGRDLGQVLQPVAAEPDTLDYLQPDLGGFARDLVEPVLDRIGADAIGDLGEIGEVLSDLFGRDVGARHQRRLGVAEWRIGDAQQLGVGVDRRARQRDRRGQPPPHRGDQTQGYQEKRQRRT